MLKPLRLPLFLSSRRATMRSKHLLVWVFQVMHALTGPLLDLNTIMYRVRYLWRHHNIQIIWIWKQMNRKVIVIYVLAGKYSVIVCYVDVVVILQSTDIWASFITSLILRSYLEYAFMWFIAWTYEQKTLVTISFRCEIYEWQIILNLHAIEWFQLSACKRLLINVINIYNITNHHNLEQRASRTAYI